MKMTGLLKHVIPNDHHEMKYIIYVCCHGYINWTPTILGTIISGANYPKLLLSHNC